MKIAIYGGTFDPIHHGHLILAREAVEKLGLDRLIFVPNTISPHKLARQAASPVLRLAMVRAAIAGEGSFAVDDLEIHRGGPSYAIETVEALQAREPGAEWVYLIGGDNIAALHTWKRFAELERLVQFVVFTRPGDSAAHAYPVIQRQIEISATEIRERVAKGLSIRYLVPEPVREIIARENLYQESTH
ncbi:MAG: nicotinate-nucleotide adenylyltransferase [Chthoniobacteraceae bacterium]